MSMRVALAAIAEIETSNTSLILVQHHLFVVPRQTIADVSAAFVSY